MNALQTIRTLEALRKSDDPTVAMCAKAISDRLVMFNATPSAGDYGAELDRAERFVEAQS